ncbi:unnamed protein product, partial [marine sediment metagenome]
MRREPRCYSSGDPVIVWGRLTMARVLLVDDEPSILSVLSTLLKAEGYDVVSALGGEKAKELLASHEFDLMISDIQGRIQA